MDKGQQTIWMLIAFVWKKKKKIYENAMLHNKSSNSAENYNEIICEREKSHSTKQQLMHERVYFPATPCKQ